MNLSACILAALLAVSLADGQETIKTIDESDQAAVKRFYSAKTAAEEKAASEEFQASARSSSIGRWGCEKPSGQPGVGRCLDVGHPQWPGGLGAEIEGARDIPPRVYRQRPAGRGLRLGVEHRGAGVTRGRAAAARSDREEPAPEGPRPGVFQPGRAAREPRRHGPRRQQTTLVLHELGWRGGAQAADLADGRRPLGRVRVYGRVAKTYPDLEHARTGKTLGAVALAAPTGFATSRSAGPSRRSRAWTSTASR